VTGYFIVGLKLQFVSDFGLAIRFLIASDVVKSNSSEIFVRSVCSGHPHTGINQKILMSSSLLSIQQQDW
jgi:hypothetical protein